MTAILRLKCTEYTRVELIAWSIGSLEEQVAAELFDHLLECHDCNERANEVTEVIERSQLDNKCLRSYIAARTNSYDPLEALEQEEFCEHSALKTIEWLFSSNLWDAQVEQIKEDIKQSQKDNANCKLSAYRFFAMWAGALDQQESDEFNEHLSVCVTCQQSCKLLGKSWITFTKRIESQLQSLKAEILQLMNAELAEIERRMPTQSLPAVTVTQAATPTADTGQAAASAPAKAMPLRRRQSAGAALKIAAMVLAVVLPLVGAGMVLVKRPARPEATTPRLVEYDIKQIEDDVLHRRHAQALDIIPAAKETARHRGETFHEAKLTYLEARALSETASLEEAIVTAKESLRLCNAGNLTTLKSYPLLLMVNIYFAMDRPADAVDYAQKAVIAAQAAGNDMHAILAMQVLSLCRFTLTRDAAQALVGIRQSVEFARAQGFEEVAIQGTYYAGIVMTEMQNYKAARRYFEEAQRRIPLFLQQPKTDYLIIATNAYYARLEATQGNAYRAAALYEQALEAAERTRLDRSTLYWQLYEGLSVQYARIGKHKESLLCREKAQRYEQQARATCEPASLFMSVAPIRRVIHCYN